MTGVNSFECLYKDIDYSEFRNGVLVVTAVGPIVFAGMITVYWFVLIDWFSVLKCGSKIHPKSCCSKKHGDSATGLTAATTITATTAATPTPTSTTKAKRVTYTKTDALVSSIVLLWFIALPSLLRISTASLKCYKVGDTSYVFIDLEKPCLEGQHFLYSFLIASPMIVFYGGVLPVIFMLRLRRAGSARLTHPGLMLRWGMLHSGYREEKYWWELVSGESCLYFWMDSMCCTFFSFFFVHSFTQIVLMRKYFVISLVTFQNRDIYQLHLALGVIIFQLHLTDSQKPFGHFHIDPINWILHFYETTSLLVLLFMLWCAYFFQLGLCQSDSVWCTFLVTLVLLSNLSLIVLLVLIFFKEWCKIKSRKLIKKVKKICKSGTVENESKVRRLSSRQLIEMTQPQESVDATAAACTAAVEIAEMEKGVDAKINVGINPMMLQKIQKSGGKKGSGKVGGSTCELNMDIVKGSDGVEWHQILDPKTNKNYYAQVGNYSKVTWTKPTQ